MNHTPSPAGAFRRIRILAGAGLLLVGIPVHAQKDTINLLVPYEESQGFELMFDSTAASFRNLFANYAQNNTTGTTLHAGWNMDTTQTDPDRPGTFFRSIVSSGVSGTVNVDNRSRRQYRDFDWRFEYRNSGNQGVMYRFDASGGYSWHTGIEYAIDNNITQTTLKFRAGAAYDLFAPSVQAYFVRNTNRWNELRIVAKGDSVEHWLNGVRVVSFRYWSAAFLAAFQDSKWTTFNRFCQTAANNRTFIPAGFIGLQGDHGGAWQIRRMRILHDSLPGMDRVRFGPVNTTVGVKAPEGHVAGSLAGPRLRVERLSGGLRLLAADGYPLRAVELRALDGRLARSERPSSHAHTLDVSGLRGGLYVLQVETASGRHHEKVMIH
jgi:hypothetical protein